MCEANAYIAVNGDEDMVMKSLDRVDPQPDGTFLLIDIFGNRKTVRGRLKRMSLVDHRVVFEPAA